MHALYAHILKIVKFIREDIWRIRGGSLRRPLALLLKGLRILVLAFRGLAEDHGPLRASALTFWTLLSVVPVLAMLFGIAKGFGFQKTLVKQLITQLQGQEEVLKWIIDFAHRMLAHTQGGVIAGVGVVVLFWSIFKLLRQVEQAFDDIWGIPKGRSLGRKVTDYLAVLLIAPILFFLSSTLTVLVSGQIKVFVDQISLLAVISPGIHLLLRFLPHCALWILFTFIYVFMPNTRVRLVAGAVAGIAAGSLYYLFQWTYIAFQIGVTRYNTIYGSFAALPLFLVWLNTSWLIVLFGAEIAFACQNVDTYELEPDFENVSPAAKRLLSLHMVHLLVKGFSESGKSWTDEEMSAELDVPIRLVRQILFELSAAGIVSRVQLDDERALAYQPARDPDDLTIHYVTRALERRGRNDLPRIQSEERERIATALRSFEELIRNSPANVRLGDM